MAVKAARRGGSLLWLQGLACGVLATFALPVALFAVALLAPAVLAATVDRTPGRPVARSTLLAGAAASLHPVVLLWQQGHDLGSVLALLAEPGVLPLSWAACAAGWLMAQTAPVLIATGMNARTNARIALLKAARRRCEAEWDIPPAG